MNLLENNINKEVKIDDFLQGNKVKKVKVPDSPFVRAHKLLATGCENTSERRMRKYVNEVKDIVFSQYVQKVLMPELRSHSKDFNLFAHFKNLNNIYEFIRMFLITHFEYCFTENWSGDLHDSLCLVPEYISQQEHREIIQQLIKFDDNNNIIAVNSSDDKNTDGTALKDDIESNDLLKGMENLNEIIDNAFEWACDNYLYYKRVQNPLLNESNMFFEIPDAPEDIIMILKTVLSVVMTDFLYALFNVNKDSDIEVKSQVPDDGRSNLMSEIEKLKIEIAGLKGKLAAANKKAEEADEKIQDAYSSCEEMISLNNRKYVRLAGEYNSLSDKYKKLQNNQENNQKENTKIEENIEIDMNKRYVFIIENDVGLTEQIKKSFPNAVFSESENIKEMKADLVIFLTAFVSHSKYSKIKNQCKNNNIPYVHCPFSNVDMIKNAIWSTG